MSNIVLNGLNCSDFFTFFLYDFRKAFALDFYVEYDLFEGLICSANCFTKYDNGNCCAIDAIEFCILRLFAIVKRVAFYSERFELW